MVVASSSGSHGCHELPTLLGTHILDMGPSPTVKSKDMKPSSMSSIANGFVLLDFHVPFIVLPMVFGNNNMARMEIIEQHTRFNPLYNLVKCLFVMLL